VLIAKHLNGAEIAVERAHKGFPGGPGRPPAIIQPRERARGVDLCKNVGGSKLQCLRSEDIGNSADISVT